jgi:hypothetical protein
MDEQIKLREKIMAPAVDKYQKATEDLPTISPIAQTAGGSKD